MAFSDLKKNRNNLDKLSKMMDKMDTKKSYADDRFWYPKKDKAGNGFAVIRFLPESDGETETFVSVYSHSFKSPNGKWYIENCPTTLGRDDCPVCHANSELWNSGIDSNKKIVSERKRRLSYISNVYVISDPVSPENEGKVFLYKYGKKVMDKIESAMKPEFPSDPKFNPFEFWGGDNGELPGADFELKIRQYEGYPNYDKSQFKTSSEFMKGDDKKLQKVWESQYKLSEFVDPAQFKSGEELAKKYAFVMGKAAVQQRATTEDNNADVGGEEAEDDAQSYYRDLANAS